MDGDERDAVGAHFGDEFFGAGIAFVVEDEEVGAGESGGVESGIYHVG